jgi:crotonobetainyl-CoA:carnitine CoA-transferase CaiB-like acyl-CoA transferase
VLLRAADVVVEASRPRALQQLGIDAADLLAGGPRVWLSITGFGRDGPGGQRVAFGDDAAVSGGLVAQPPGSDGPCFVADAVADPLTGLVAAAAVLDACSSGGRVLLDVALARVAASVASAAAGEPWREADATTARAPVPPVPSGRAARFGEHTDAVLREFGA